MKDSLKYILAITLALPFLACCSGSETDPGDAGTFSGNESNPIVTPQSSNVSVAPLELNRSSYLITTTEKEVFKVSAFDGEIERIFDARSDLSGAFLGPAEVVRDVAYISATDNSVWVINIETGEFMWRFLMGPTSNSENPSAPICSSTTCYVQNETDDLIAFKTDTGETEWVTSILDDAPPGKRAIASRFPLIKDGLVFIGIDYDNETYSLNIYSAVDGSLQTRVEMAAQITGPPVEVDGKLLLVSGKSLVAIDSTSYELIWSTEPSFDATDPVIAGSTAVMTIFDPDNVHVSSSFGSVGVDINTGEIIWAITHPDRSFAFRPTSDGNVALLMAQIVTTPEFVGQFPNQSGGVPNGINPENGSPLWNLQDLRGTARREPLAVPGFFFFTELSSSGNGFNVTALNANDGSIRWLGTGTHEFDIRLFATVFTLVHEGEVYRPAHFPTINKL